MCTDHIHQTAADTCLLYVFHICVVGKHAPIETVFGTLLEPLSVISSCAFLPGAACKKCPYRCVINEVTGKQHEGSSGGHTFLAHPVVYVRCA